MHHSPFVFASSMKVVILFATLCGALCVQSTDPIVTTKVGVIRGLRDEERGFSKFLGIPYGQVDNVFGAATPHPLFEDIFDANDDTRVCTQVQTVAYGSPDCLNMNIYVPDSASIENPLPVLVWLHGGAFILGSAQQARDPIYLLRHDIIVVAVNYRLGVFGFMCLDIPEVPGNTGLKDQLIALRWVNENIEAFGGDANQITLGGVSAGGMSANLHLLSPYEKLFDRVIIHSGTANSYWTMIESDNTIPIRIAEALNFVTTDIYEALEFLSGVEPTVIALTAHTLLITNAGGVNQPLTKPCLEKKFDGVENFMTEHPINIKSDKVSTTSVILGYTDTEFAFQYASIGPEFFESYEFIQHFRMGFNMSNDLNEAMDLVKHFYIGDDDISEDYRWEMIDFGSDFIFNHAAQRMAEKLIEDGADTVYSFVFSHNGTMDVPYNKIWNGSTHGEDMQYLFAARATEETAEEDWLIIYRFNEMWSNFVKYGDPTPQVTELLPVRWLPISDTNYTYLDIRVDMDLKSRPFHDRMAFWDLFYSTYGHFQKWYEGGED